MVKPMTPDPATTIERPPGYELEIEQPAKGYRYNQDPFHLVQFINDHAGPWRTQLSGECLDVGCGVGILPLLLARHLPDTRFTGIEIQEELARLANANVKRNRLSRRIKIINLDYRDLCREASEHERFQSIICNPPYYPLTSGRTNLCPQKRIARHEQTTSLDSLTRAAAHFLSRKGLFITLFPAERLLELTTHLKAAKLEPKHLQFIHPETSDRATMLLLAARKNGAPGIIIEKPLTI
jgi:tRNA1Val (adenine37-N6)-methyltransferase